ncbi:hypothetical protein NDU88_002876 [Pleurodeles waltl]|uniref:Uncharacterized protein n=1 Tax=Pleurodeles waltl TaxID=8319 RepID=A0AAV7VBT6_PLEWA|nr:hypothetical protein NDU88_002876 [Pleurodeles waltl]
MGRPVCRGRGGAGPGEDTWCSDAFAPIRRSGSDLGVVLWQAAVGGTARLVSPRGLTAGSAVTRGLLPMSGGALRLAVQGEMRRPHQGSCGEVPDESSLTQEPSILVGWRRSVQVGSGTGEQRWEKSGDILAWETLEWFPAPSGRCAWL